MPLDINVFTFAHLGISAGITAIGTELLYRRNIAGGYLGTTGNYARAAALSAAAALALGMLKETNDFYKVIDFDMIVTRFANSADGMDVAADLTGIVLAATASYALHRNGSRLQAAAKRTIHTIAKLPEYLRFLPEYISQIRREPF